MYSPSLLGLRYVIGLSLAMGCNPAMDLWRKPTPMSPVTSKPAQFLLHSNLLYTIPVASPCCAVARRNLWQLTDRERFIAQCKRSREQVLESKTLLRRTKKLQDEIDRRPEMVNEDIIPDCQARPSPDSCRVRVSPHSQRKAHHVAYLHENIVHRGSDFQGRTLENQSSTERAAERQSGGPSCRQTILNGVQPAGPIWSNSPARMR